MNEEVLKMAMKAIEVERAPKKGWNQGVWATGMSTGEIIENDYFGEQCVVLDMEACGSTMCLAGQIVHQAGYQLISTWQEGKGGERKLGGSYCRDPETGQFFSIRQKAQDLLGVDYHMATALFLDSSHIASLREFKRYVTRATGVEL